jgi:predicted secreted protein
MRSSIATLVLVVPVLFGGACASAPDAGGGTAAGTMALDPERVTVLGFYGGRCAGEPSIDGVDGVTGVELEVGQTFVAELQFAAGTGYAWTATGFDTSIAEIPDQRERPIRGSAAVGATQLATINLTAKTPGRTRVRFELRRSWEASAAPAEIRHTTIYVKQPKRSDQPA